MPSPRSWPSSPSPNSARAGVFPATRVAFHTLRHTAGSWLTIRGASLRSGQEILGRNNPSQTEGYSHLATAHIRADLDRLAGLVKPVAAAHGVAQLAECATQVPVAKT